MVSHFAYFQDRYLHLSGEWVFVGDNGAGPDTPRCHTLKTRPQNIGTGEGNGTILFEEVNAQVPGFPDAYDPGPTARQPSSWLPSMLCDTLLVRYECYDDTIGGTDTDAIIGWTTVSTPGSLSRSNASAEVLNFIGSESDYPVAHLSNGTFLFAHSRRNYDEARKLGWQASASKGFVGRENGADEGLFHFYVIVAPRAERWVDPGQSCITVSMKERFMSWPNLVGLDSASGTVLISDANDGHHVVCVLSYLP